MNHTCKYPPQWILFFFPDFSHFCRDHVEEREISAQNVKKLFLCKKNLKKEQLAILAVTAEIGFQNALKIRVMICMVTNQMRSDRSLHGPCDYTTMSLFVFAAHCFSVIHMFIAEVLPKEHPAVLQASEMHFPFCGLSEKPLGFLNNNWTCLWPAEGLFLSRLVDVSQRGEWKHLCGAPETPLSPNVTCPREPLGVLPRERAFGIWSCYLFNHWERIWCLCAAYTMVKLAVYHHKRFCLS